MKERGMVGSIPSAGLTAVPIACFEKALDAFAAQQGIQEGA